MLYINKKEKQSQPVSILSVEDKFYILSDNVRIRKDIFDLYYDEVISNNTQNVVKINENKMNINDDVIDPNAFFSNSSVANTLINDLKQIDTSKVSDAPGQTTVNKIIDPDNFDRVARYNKENNISLQNQQNNITLQPKKNGQERVDPSLYPVYDDEDAAYDDFLNKKTNPQVVQTQSNQQKINYNDEEFLNGPKVTNNVQRIEKIEENPAILWLKTFKKGHKVSFKMDIDAMIPDPDFLKLMSNNIDYDIIDYYTDETIKSLLDDKNKLKTFIYNYLQEYIVGKPKKVVKKPTLKKEVIIVEEPKEEIKKEIKIKKTKKINKTDENI